MGETESPPPRGWLCPDPQEASPLCSCSPAGIFQTLQTVEYHPARVFLTREQAPDRRLVAGVGGGGSARIAVAPCWGVVPATQNHAMFQLRLPELYLQTNYKTKNKYFSKSLSPATLTAMFLPMLSNLKPLINREPQLMKSAPRRGLAALQCHPLCPLPRL